MQERSKPRIRMCLSTKKTVICSHLKSSFILVRKQHHFQMCTENPIQCLHYAVTKIKENNSLSPLFQCKCKFIQECIPVGCVPAARRPYAGVCFLGGGCLPGPGGVLLLGGCLVGGVWHPGGVCLVRGGSGIPACTEADTPPVDRHTPVKTLPWPQLRCGR